MRYVAVILALALLAGFLIPHVIGVPDKTPYHYSYFSQRQFFDNAYANAPATPTPNEMPRGLVVNHHLLAANLIAQAFKAIEGTPGTPTIVLLSPNHFGTGNGQITTSTYYWQTPYGLLETDRSLIAKLSAAGQVTIDPRPFAKEHGISGIVAFIKKSLPDAKVVPIIFKSTLTEPATVEFAENLRKNLPPNSIIVASVDMSHYVAEDIALKQDRQTIAALESSNLQNLWQSNTDSPPAMLTLLTIMQDKNLTFHLLQRSSSAEIAHVTDPLDNTSYITGYWNKS